MNFYAFFKGVATFKCIFLSHFSTNFERFGATTEFGERSIGLEIFQVAAQNLHDPNTALDCSALAPIVVAAYIAGDLTLNLGKPLSGRKL